MVVSILILLDSILLSMETLDITYQYLMFQSLFYWILFSYRLNKILIITNYFMFQSLFYWILFSYPFYRADSLFSTLIEFF